MDARAATYTPLDAAGPQGDVHGSPLARSQRHSLLVGVVRPGDLAERSVALGGVADAHAAIWPETEQHAQFRHAETPVVGE